MRHEGESKEFIREDNCVDGWTVERKGRGDMRLIVSVRTCLTQMGNDNKCELWRWNRAEPCHLRASWVQCNQYSIIVTQNTTRLQVKTIPSTYWLLLFCSTTGLPLEEHNLPPTCSQRPLKQHFESTQAQSRPRSLAILILYVRA